MTSNRSSSLPHLAGLSSPTNFSLNRMDLPCSRRSLGCMLAVRTPGAPQATRTHARPAIPPSPLSNRVGYSDERSISGLFFRSLYSGLQPPCLRSAVAVTGHHARLGTRLLARLCRGRHLRRQSSTHLHGATPDRTQHADFLALRSPVCFSSTLMGPIWPGRLSVLVADPGSR
jgi:hypothetical protein